MESEIIFSRSGYECRYGIGIDDELISSYRENLHVLRSSRRRQVILEVRTNFILKTTSGDENIIDSERFGKIFPVDFGNLGFREHNVFPDDFGDIDLVDKISRQTYRASLSYRLREYWLPEKEVARIADEASCFVKRTAADPRHDSLHVIPVVVCVDVCTVQLPGELLDEVVLRSIKPDRLIPFSVWGMSIVLAEKNRQGGSFQLSEETLGMGFCLRMYLISLAKVRVEDVAESGMEVCPICLQPPTYGTQITTLAYCQHVFHNHCIVRWLMKNETCPVCPPEDSISLPWDRVS